MKKYIALLILITGLSTTVNAQSEPPYGMSEIAAYSIFYDNYRTGDYEMALQFGKWMLEAKPKTIEGATRFSLDQQYRRMINVYTELANEQSDPSEKSKYLDLALGLYDDAFETFSEEEIDYFEWNYRKGRFYQEHSNDISNGMDMAYEQYKVAFELDAERFAEAGDGYFVRILLDNYVNNDQRDEALAMIEILEPIGGQEVEEAISDARDSIFDSPEERITFLESQLAADEENLELLNELASLYERQGDRAKAIETAEKLYELDASYDNTRKLADYAKSDAQYEKALTFLKEAREKTDEQTQKRNISLEIAEAYQNLNQFESARSFARQAIDIDPNWGDPYLRIASIYAGTISRCTSDRTIDRDDRSVYWLVLDYLDKAESADSSVANRVQRDKQTYQSVLPSSEDKFFRGWTTGDKVMVDGNINSCYSWIGEETTVR
ncbi:MAG: hypothetical protein WEA58_08735 [Balneolaceae bacterium]